MGFHYILNPHRSSYVLVSNPHELARLDCIIVKDSDWLFWVRKVRDQTVYKLRNGQHGTARVKRQNR